MASLYDTLRDKLDEQDSFEKYVYGGLLTIVFGLALWARYMPAAKMDFLQALDPYMIGRMSASIAENGFMPSVDVTRFFPFFTPTHLLNNGNIVVPAFLFNVVRMFGVNFVGWAKFYPALMGALAVLPVYFIGKRMFGRRTGVISAFFLATSAAIMHRSSAGWFEKEPIANVLMIASMYFFMKAWDEADWLSGIFSGIFLGVSATSWGGTNYLFLLYPLTVFGITGVLPILASIPVMLFDGVMNRIDVKGFFRAFTPVAILGTVLPFILNGSRSTWMIPNKFFYVNMAVLAFLAVRYVVDEYEMVSKDIVPYMSHILVSVGAVLLLLSPLYSQTIANRFTSIMKTALQTGGGVIGGTVAENTPASISQMVSQLGASMSARILPGAAFYAEFFSGWTFSLIGVSILLVYFIHLAGKQYFDFGEADTFKFAGGTSFSVALVSLFVFLGLSGAQATAFIPAILITVLVTTLYYFYESSEDSIEQWKIALFFFWGGILLLTAFSGLFILTSILVMAQGGYLMFQTGKTFGSDFGWSSSLVMLWMFSTVYGATQKSRLIFLTASPVAMVAGIGVSRAYDFIKSSSFWDSFDFGGDMDALKIFASIMVVVFVVVNISAVTAMAKSISGSPNPEWMENLDHMKEETPEGSVILSWWDYGYWFQSIGERSSVADGGNMGYYRKDNDLSKVNLPLADFLTSHNPSNHTDFLEKYGADYIVLDSTMIGKYSAVSQISNRDNDDFNVMQEADCARKTTAQGTTCKVSEVEGDTVIHYEMGNLEILVPFSQDDGFKVDGTPIIRSGGRSVQVSNVCTENGVVETDAGTGTKGGFDEALRESFRDNKPFGGCISLNPPRKASRIAIVPPAIMDSTLVRLYLMDGEGIDFVEKVFDNGFAKMWKIKN